MTLTNKEAAELVENASTRTRALLGQLDELHLLMCEAAERELNVHPPAQHKGYLTVPVVLSSKGKGFALEEFICMSCGCKVSHTSIHTGVCPGVTR